MSNRFDDDEDPLAAAKGMANGLILGGIIWLVLIGIAVFVIGCTNA